MIVTPARFLTRMRRAFPSSTSFLIRSMTRSTPSSSMWNVSNSDSFVVGISLLLLRGVLQCRTGLAGRFTAITSRWCLGYRCPRDTHVVGGFRVREREQSAALGSHGIQVPPLERHHRLDEQRRGAVLSDDLPERADKSVDQHRAECPFDPR